MRIKSAEPTASERAAQAVNGPKGPENLAGEDIQRPASMGAPGTETALMLSIDSLAIVPAEFFKPNGSDALLATLEAEVRKQAADLDISTDAGRKAIASLAYKIAKTKTGLDGARKDLVADQKAAIKAVDQEGSRVWDRLELLQSEVRKPLTDWENAEKLRIAAHEAMIERINQLADFNGVLGVADVRARTTNVLEIATRDWQEFGTRASRVVEMATIKLRDALEASEKAEAEAAELKRLRAEEVDREKRERVEAIAEEARAAERRKAEAQMEEQRQAAEAERIRVENERNEAAARAQQAEAERVQAEERAASELQESERRAQAERERAERQARETAERVERERVEAAERAQRDQDAAVEAERKRIERELQRANEEAEARERNKAHRKKIHKEAADRIAEIITAAAAAPASDLPAIFVDSIAKGLVPHVKIEY